jgi:C-terminal processing protease CtpA/Prc
MSAAARSLALASVILLGLPATLPAQRLNRVDRERVQAVLRDVRREVERRYYDSTFKGLDLGAAHDTADARIRAASGIDEALAAVAQFSLELQDSHTFFVPPQRTLRVEYGWEMAMIGDSCFVTEVEPNSDPERQGVKGGDLVLSLNGHRPTRANSWTLFYLYQILRPQPGLRVTLRPPGGEPRELDLAASTTQAKRILDFTGADGGGDIARALRESDKSDRELRSRFVELDDDVLIWKLPTFSVETSAIREGLKRGRERSTLILDLRDNGGGLQRTMLALLGSLSRDDVPVGTLIERGRETPLAAKGSGDDAYGGRLLILTDSRSASASEVVARVAQLTTRGRVIGDRTAGSVMRGSFRTFSTGMETVVAYGVSVTSADLVMSDGGRLERQGVVPDVVLLPTAGDLAAGRDPVLSHALSLAGKSVDPASAAALLR